jgi:UDP-GlcNAc:undecaprenyl-phosphate GlcNAc-1-phosphate transferase
MQVLLILGLSSFLFTLILTPLCRNLFLRTGMVDHPDGERKLHSTPIANMGGIPIVLACLCSFAVLSMFGRTLPAGIGQSALALRVMPAVAIVFIVGLLDDRFNLQPLQKLIAQIAASAWAFSEGVRITNMAGHQLPVWLGFIATTVWLIACANAFNLIDGVDGLAAGVGLFATATMLIAALMQKNVALAAATAPLVGALLGFLRYNFNPATIFLGDSGSLLIGFLLGCFGIVWSQKSATILGMTAPLMALSIPILDVCLSVVRRFLRREPLLRGDRGHIHHRLLDLGLTQRQVVVILYAACGIAACFSIFQSVTANHFSGAVILVFCAVAWVGVQNLGYAEFDQARRMILAGGFRRALNSQLTLRSFEETVSSSTTTDQCWDALQELAQKLGFAEVSWKVGYHHYRRALWHIDGNNAWSVRIPLSGQDYVGFVRASDADPAVINVSVLAEVMRKGMTGADRKTPPRVATATAEFAGNAGHAPAAR